jgi:AcrR family transcriptional regulator
MGRSYDMRQRSRTAAETRAGIIAAAHRLLGRRDGTLTLQEVAAAAGVSRATIYKSVGSRVALLAAVFEDQGRLVGYDKVLVAMRLPDPARAVVATVRESCRAWAVMPEAIRKTLALSVLDEEAGPLVERYERYRRAELAGLARRAHRARVLGAGVSAGDAATALALLTGFPAYDQLRLTHNPRQATRQLVQMATASLGLSRNED